MNFKFFFMILLLIATALVTFIHDSFSQSTSFEKHILSTDFEQGCEVFIHDVNKDGFADIIGGGNGNNGQVVWWENTGYHEFIEHSVAENLLRARSVSAHDLNADGEIDIVAAAWEGGTITWYENDGEENWSKHFVDDDFLGAHTVDIKDVDFDGKPDVLCSQFDNSSAYSEIAWWKNNLPDTVWTKHVISTRFKQSPFIFGDDIDGDGDVDILACGELNGEVYWWENDGNQNWTEHMIDDDFPKAHTVFIRNVDGDDDMDIVGAACMSSKIAWWENDGNENFTKHDMGSFAGALWFDITDLDMDGDQDFYGGGQGEAKLAWWENDGNQNFTKYIFDDPFSQTFSIVHGDLDNDGDPDLVATGYMSNQTSWFANQLYQPNIYDKPECVVYDQALDRYIVANVGNGTLVETDTLNNNNYWLTSHYERLYGMCIDGNILYTSDGDTLLGFHLLTKELVLSMHLPNTNNLDGMTSDGNGFLYVIDTGGRLMKIDIEDETWELLASDGIPNWPQDCVYDPFNNRIVIACFEASSPIVGVDAESGEVSTLTTNSVGRYDGITIDQYGNFYFSTFVGGGRVHKYPNDFSNYYAVAYGLGEPTGLNYNQYDNILAIPSFNQDTVYFIRMTQTGIADPQPGSSLDFELFPNPCSDVLHIQYTGLETRDSRLEIRDLKLEVVSSSGTVVKSLPVNDRSSENQEISIDMREFPAGIYLVRVKSHDAVGVRKLVVR